jgi:[acyl-carrier-protein] S-malonyltransferase
MGRALAEAFPDAREVFETADRVLGLPLSRLCFDGPEDELKLTANTQPAILTTPDYVAGHSLGEYSALVASGSLRFEDAVNLVRQRGLFMQDAVAPGEGAMAAIVGCDLDAVKSVCNEASLLGVCAPANMNTPNQTVIAGQTAAVQRAVELARERGAKRAVMLNVSAPFHCEMMQPAAERLSETLTSVEFKDLTVPLVTNAEADFIGSGAEARQSLAKQVASPVLWSDSVARLLAEGVAVFVEVGAGKVLSGLVRQIDRKCRIMNAEDPGSLGQVVEALTQKNALGAVERPATPA